MVYGTYYFESLISGLAMAHQILESKATMNV